MPCLFFGGFVSPVLQNPEHSSDTVWNLILQLEEVGHVFLHNLDHKIGCIFCGDFLCLPFGPTHGKEFIDVDSVAHAGRRAFDT